MKMYEVLLLLLDWTGTTGEDLLYCLQYTLGTPVETLSASLSVILILDSH